LEGMYLLGLCANPRASNCRVTANTVVEPLESGALSLQVPEDLPNLPLLHSCIVPDELRYCNPFDVSRNVYNRHPTSLAKCPDDPHSSGIRNFRVSGSVPSMEERRTKYSVCRVLVYGVSFVMPSSVLIVKNTTPIKNPRGRTMRLCQAGCSKRAQAR
jgi:hypothetical protein